jgi:hypothetical protein
MQYAEKQNHSKPLCKSFIETILDVTHFKRGFYGRPPAYLLQNEDFEKKEGESWQYAPDRLHIPWKQSSVCPAALFTAPSSKQRLQLDSQSNQRCRVLLPLITVPASLR